MTTFPSTPGQAWLALLLAGALDVGWALSMKAADGYTRPGWSLVSFVLLAAFVFLLGRALAVLPVGVAYAAWTGIGAAGTLAFGAVVFGEPLTAPKLVGVGLIVAGVVALRVA